LTKGVFYYYSSQKLKAINFFDCSARSWGIHRFSVHCERFFLVETFPSQNKKTERRIEGMEISDLIRFLSCGQQSLDCFWRGDFIGKYDIVSLMGSEIYSYLPRKRDELYVFSVIGSNSFQTRIDLNTKPRTMTIYKDETAIIPTEVNLYDADSNLSQFKLSDYLTMEKWSLHSPFPYKLVVNHRYIVWLERFNLFRCDILNNFRCEKISFECEGSNLCLEDSFISNNELFVPSYLFYMPKVRIAMTIVNLDTLKSSFYRSKTFARNYQRCELFCVPSAKYVIFFLHYQGSVRAFDIVKFDTANRVMTEIKTGVKSGWPHVPHATFCRPTLKTIFIENEGYFNFDGVHSEYDTESFIGRVDEDFNNFVTVKFRMFTYGRRCRFATCPELVRVMIKDSDILVLVVGNRSGPDPYIDYGDLNEDRWELSVWKCNVKDFVRTCDYSVDKDGATMYLPWEITHVMQVDTSSCCWKRSITFVW